jgi:hypothetical protein
MLGGEHTYTPKIAVFARGNRSPRHNLGLPYVKIGMKAEHFLVFQVRITTLAA